jgi:hypothetical protein
MARAKKACPTTGCIAVPIAVPIAVLTIVNASITPIEILIYNR